MKKKKADFKKLALSKEVIANINGGNGNTPPPTIFCNTVGFCDTRDFTNCDGGAQCRIFATIEPHCRTF